MVRNNEILDLEPTPEFNARCLEIIRQWHAGDVSFKETMQAISEMQEEAVQTGHIANQGRINHIQGYIHHYRGNLNTSIMHYDKARELYAHVNNHRRVASMDLNQGENYRNKGEFTRARRLYRAAYEISAELGDIRLQSMAVVNEGLVLVSMGDYINARVSLEEGFELSNHWTERLEDVPLLRCEIHHGLATIALVENQPAVAWGEALAALENATDTQQPIQVGYANRILGEVLTVLGQSPDPEFSSNPDDYYRAARDAFDEIKAEGELGRTLFSQAKSLAKRGKMRPAARMLQEVMIIFTKLGMTHDAASAAEAQLAMI